MPFFSKFDGSACKNELQMAANRAKIYENRLNISSKKLKGEIAELLRSSKEDLARAKVDRLVLDEKLEKGYEELQHFCKMLAERTHLIEQSKTLPTDLIPLVHTILYCESRMDISELHKVKKELQSKFGKGLIDSAKSDTQEEVHHSIRNAVSLVPPENHEILEAFTNIAKTYKLDWSPVKGVSSLDYVPKPKASYGGFGSVNKSIPVNRNDFLKPAAKNELQKPANLISAMASAPAIPAVAEAAEKPPSLGFQAGFYTPQPSSSPALFPPRPRNTSFDFKPPQNVVQMFPSTDFRDLQN